MADSAVLDSALFQYLIGCNPHDVYNKLFQNMAGTMNDAVDTLQSNLLEEFKDECEEIKKCCHAMRQELVHKKSKYFVEELADYCSHNIFYIPRHTSKSAIDSSYVEPDEQLSSTSSPDLDLLFAIAEKLIKNITMVDEAIQERRKLLEQVKNVKKKCDLLSQNVQIGNDLLKNDNIQKSLASPDVQT